MIDKSQLDEWRKQYSGIDRARTQAAMAGNHTAAICQSYAMHELATDVIPQLLDEVERLSSENAALTAASKDAVIAMDKAAALIRSM